MRARRMVYRWVAAAAIVALGAGCGQEPGGDRNRRGSWQAARAMIWNPAPGPAVPGGAPGSLAPRTGGAQTLRSALTAADSSRTLVLYDSTGPYAALGELYAIGTANLVSHFGGWTAKPAAGYSCGEIEAYGATIYLGSTYDEPLPPCLLDDVFITERPVIWSFYNLWQLTSRAGFAAFVARYGFTWTALDVASVGEVRYKGRALVRYAGNLAGILATQVTDSGKATVLATAVRADGTTLPWAIRGSNLTFVGEIPFSYMSEEDRFVVFADLLFDALAPATPERHRALVRLEDIDPLADPEALRAIADLLHAEGVPFGFGVVPEHRDPRGVYNDGVSLRVTLAERPVLVAALGYMQSRGGVAVMHGKTHQWSGGINPYTQVTGDDTEFYRVIENADHSVSHVGPLPQDSAAWVDRRISAGSVLFVGAGLLPPRIFEFPHYAGSATAYRAVAARFATRWERTLYFAGVLGGTPVDYGRIFGQLFPFVVQDVYGTKVLPENLGNIEPEAFYIFPPRSPADLIRAAEKNLVVRDGFAAFYFHPIFDPELLRETIHGIRALGYTFVSPESL